MCFINLDLIFNHWIAEGDGGRGDGLAGCRVDADGKKSHYRSNVWNPNPIKLCPWCKLHERSGSQIKYIKPRHILYWKLKFNFYSLNYSDWVNPNLWPIIWGCISVSLSDSKQEVYKWKTFNNTKLIYSLQLSQIKGRVCETKVQCSILGKIHSFSWIPPSLVKSGNSVP